MNPGAVLAWTFCVTASACIIAFGVMFLVSMAEMISAMLRGDE